MCQGIKGGKKLNNLAAFYLHKFLEADKRNKELEHQNKMLKNRCAVYGQGQMCQFCPYDCDNRTQKFKGDK